MKNIKGLIFAAGLGTRLKPFTLNNPKALVPVGGKPMLEHVIDRFVALGINDIVINVHHFADKIIHHIATHPRPGVTFHISDESDLLLDTGGGILHARNLLDSADAVLVHNADILSDVNLGALIDNHIASGNMATLLVAERETSRYLYFDNVTMRLRGWSDLRNGAVRPSGFVRDDKTMRRRAFAGIHVFNPTIYPKYSDFAFDAGPVFSIIPFYTTYCADIPVGGYEQSEPYNWFDVGKPESLDLANIFINSGL